MEPAVDRREHQLARAWASRKASYRIRVPPSDGRGTSARLRAPDVVVVAAEMEPAAERREHPNRCLSSFAWNWPQWSPPSDGGSSSRRWMPYRGTTLGTAFGNLFGIIGPQWSPPFDAGSTLQPQAEPVVRRVAAMEPAVGRREHRSPATS